jgi:hypothetical protein
MAVVLRSEYMKMVRLFVAIDGLIAETAHCVVGVSIGEGPSVGSCLNLTLFEDGGETAKAVGTTAQRAFI